MGYLHTLCVTVVSLKALSVFFIDVLTLDRAFAIKCVQCKNCSTSFPAARQCGLPGYNYCVVIDYKDRNYTLLATDRACWMQKTVPHCSWAIDMVTKQDLVLCRRSCRADGCNGGSRPAPSSWGVTSLCAAVSVAFNRLLTAAGEM